MSGQARHPAKRAARAEPAWVRWALLTLALAFVFLFLLLPLAAVFVEAFRKGLDGYVSALAEPEALSAIGLTLLVAVVAVPVIN